MQRRVRERFAELQRLDAGVVFWKTIDAAQSVEQVEDDIWKVVDETIRSVSDQQIKTLWME